MEYLNVTVRANPSWAYQSLSELAKEGVNLLAFSAIPSGDDQTQLVLFPESSARLAGAAARIGLTLDGPYRALLVQGDDELGVVARLHMCLLDASVNAYASTGVTDGRGGFGYVIYVRPEEFDAALRALQDLDEFRG